MRRGLVCGRDEQAILKTGKLWRWKKKKKRKKVTVIVAAHSPHRAQHTH